MIPVVQFVAAFLLLSRFAVAQSSDPAPEGFRWQQVTEIMASFLVPDSWHFNVLGQSPLSFLITPDDYSKRGHYDTGFRAVVTVVKAGTSSVAEATRTRDEWAKSSRLEVSR